MKRIFQVPGPLHLENRFFKWLDYKTANKEDYWIATCKKTYEIYKTFKIKNIEKRLFLNYYGGYGGNTIKEYKENKNILHKQFALKQNEILIGMVSYFYKPKKYLGQTRGIKGHEDFIDAITRLSRENKNIRGIIIGGAWSGAKKYEERVIKYARRECGEKIIFTGFRNDLKEIYRELDIVVHPSHSENLGGAAESLAAGVPTIATNIGGFPDIVINNETGYLCNVKDSDSIVECINKMLKDYNNSLKLAKKGQELVKNLLDINVTTNKIIEIYKKIKEV